MKPRELSTFAAWLPLATLVACFAVGVTILGLGAELIVLAMLAAAAVAGVVAVRVGRTWDDVQRSTGEKFASVLPVVLILLSIGMLIGSWVLSGTIPLLVVLGVRLVDPQFLVLTAFLVTAVMSLATGTSWGSAGTLGVALMGTAAALDAPLAATAGAVVSGAYFGDKMSPLSDSTNVCAIGAGADLYAHIRHMLYTAVPSFALALAIYAVAGGRATPGGTLSDGTLPEGALRLLRELDDVYALNALALLPLAVVIGGIVLRRPPALTLAASSVLALVLGVAVQGFSVADALAAAVRGFDVGMIATLGLDPASTSELFVKLLARGGLYSMTDTLLVILAAFLLAGALDVSGALDRIIAALLAAVRSTFGLIAATMGSGALLISLTSHGGVTALIVGELFQKAYAERRLAPENLSRSLEDSVTIVEPLLPWTVSAVFMATTLGVPTVEYLPWAAFCFGGPVFSLLYAATFDRTGFGIKKT
ncbi:MAG TPA: Na+/H+ antiporter NhaC [Thermoanaerobaculia bacterium]